MEVKEIDLRTDKTKPGLTLNAGQPIYTISDSLDLGTSGPFFLDKGMAILWAFFKGNADKTLMPIKDIVSATSFFSMFEQSKTSQSQTFIEQEPSRKIEEPNSMRGVRAKSFIFPGANKVLLELKSPYTIMFDSKIEAEDPIHLNLVFCPDAKYGAKLETKIAIYQPSTTTVDLKTAHEWIDRRPDGTVNTVLSFSNLVDRRNRLEKMGKGPENIYEKITINALIICRPQQIFPNRIIYYLNWERIWEVFILSRINNYDINATRTLFASIADVKDEIIKGNGINATNKILPKTFILRLLAKLESTKDVISLCSVNSNFRAICYSSLGQKLLREKFQPWLANFFKRVVKNPKYYNIFPGIPKPFSVHNHGLWPTGFIFFQNDFISGDEEIELEDFTGKFQEINAVGNFYERELSKKKIEEETAEIRRKKLVDARIRENMAARGIVLPDVQAQDETTREEINEIIDPRRLDDETLNNIVRNSSSFISLFCMIRSMETRFHGIVVVRLFFNFRDGDDVYREDVETKAEKLLPRANKLLTGMFTGSEEDTTLYNINITDVKGSWMHETPVLPFFQNSNYVSILEKVKILELEKAKIRMNMVNVLKSHSNLKGTSKINPLLGTTMFMNPPEILKQPIINRLTINRAGESLAWIEVVTYGGIIDIPDVYVENLSERIVIIFRYDLLKPLNAKRFRNKLFLYEVYKNVNILPVVSPHYHKDDEEATKLLSGPADKIILPIMPLYNPHVGFMGEDYTGIYYAQYMFLISFIRMLVLQEGADFLDWSTNV